MSLFTDKEGESMVLAPSPSRSETLQGLAARVAAATGPDRDVDRDLWLLFGWNDGDDGDKAWARRQHIAPTEEIGGYTMAAAIAAFPHDKAIADHWNTPRLTASSDAALELAERVLPGQGWEWRLERVPDWQSGGPFHRAELSDGITPKALSRGPTPALALLSALLEALQNRPEQPA